MKTKLPALLLALTLSLTACGAAPAATGSQSAPDLSGAHALPQTMEETPPVDLPTLRLTLVDGAGTDTLLLAGETAGEVYTVPADSFPLTLDGEPADASVLEDGMPITLAYTGIEESFPARLSVAAAETYSLGTEKNPGGGFYDLCGLYLQVLSDLAEGGEETVAVDLSQAPGDLTEGEKAAIAWRFRETCGAGLADPESADPGIARFAIREAGTEGELCSLPTSQEGEAYSLPVLKFEAERSQTLPAGPDGTRLAAARILQDCTAVWPEFGAWTGYQVGSEVLACG